MTSKIPDQLALSFYIGEVVRNDVATESEMRILWSHLHRAELVTAPMPRDLGRLIRQVRPALRDERVPVAFGDIALDVLERTWVAHQLRNKLVHDQWLQLPWRPTQIASMHSATRRQLDDLESCADALLTLMWRMRGVATVMPAWLGLIDDDEISEDEIRSWTRVAMGHIASNPRQVVGTPGPAPMPGAMQEGDRDSS